MPQEGVVCPYPGCSKTYKTKNAWYHKHLNEKHPDFQDNTNQIDPTVILEQSIIQQQSQVSNTSIHNQAFIQNQSKTPNLTKSEQEYFNQSTQKQQQNNNFPKIQYEKSATGLDKKWICEFCKKAYVHQGPLKNHINKLHSQQNILQSSMQNNQNQFQNDKQNSQQFQEPNQSSNKQNQSQQNIDHKFQSQLQQQQEKQLNYKQQNLPYSNNNKYNLSSQNEQQFVDNEPQCQNKNTNEDNINFYNNPYLDKMSSNNSQHYQYTEEFTTKQPQENHDLNNNAYQQYYSDQLYLNTSTIKNNSSPDNQNQQDYKNIQQDQTIDYSEFVKGISDSQKNQQQQEQKQGNSQEETNESQYHSILSKFQDSNIDSSDSDQELDQVNSDKEDNQEQNYGENLLNKNIKIDDLYNPFIDLSEKQIDQINFIQPPKDFKITLYPFQLTGYNWLLYREQQIQENNYPEIEELFLKYYPQKQSSFKGGILADSMGLGKTCQMIALMVGNQKSKNNIANNLLVVPKALISQWESEISKFTTKGLFKVAIFHGPKKSSLNLLDFDVVITTYSTLRVQFQQQSKSNIYKYKWHRIIIDEGHNIKNKASMQSQACAGLKADHKWVLTGTPLQNQLEDIYPYLRFLEISKWSEDKEFSQAFNPICKKDKLYSPEQYKLLQEILIPIMLRRTKCSTYKDGEPIIPLPKKHEKEIQLTMNDQEQFIYNQVRESKQEQVQDMIIKKKKFACILAEITALRQLADHYCIIKESNLQEMDGLSQIIKEFKQQDIVPEKFKKVLEITQNVIQNNEKIVIFAQFLPVLYMLSDYIKINLKGVDKILKLEGKQTIEQRKQILNTFSEPNQKSVLIGSLKVGEVGLNLVAANHIILYDNWFNPTTEEQAIERVHRIGQLKEVFVYRLWYKETIEQRIEELKQNKWKMINKALHTKSYLRKENQFSKKDIMILFLPYI